MIGNDIVDLNMAASESNWKRPRYLDKIFSDQEQLIILNSENQEFTVWLLWSMKEAAYKVHIQQFGLRFFNPKKLRCQLNSNYKGAVYYEDHTYTTSSQISESIIHTVAYLKLSKNAIIKVFKTKNATYRTQSLQTKQRLLKSFSVLKSVPLETLYIQNNIHNVPKLFYNGTVQNNCFSISHHGFYGGYAILLE